MENQGESGAAINHRRRRRRAAITLTLVGLALVGGFAYAAAYFQGWNVTGSPGAPSSRSCPAVTSPQPLKPGAVTINVYNATNRAGLAASVAKLLQTQGFKVAKVTNDPLSKAIDGVAEVRRGQTGTAGASLVMTRLKGATVVPDERTDDTVDLVLGNAFTALSAPPEVAPSTAATPTPSATSSC